MIHIIDDGYFLLWVFLRIDTIDDKKILFLITIDGSCNCRHWISESHSWEIQYL